MSKKTVAITGVGKSTLNSSFSKVIENPELCIKAQENRPFQAYLDEEISKLNSESEESSQQICIILDYLETAHSGAKMMGDIETMLRLARAIVALKAPIDEDIFTQEFIGKIPNI